MKEDQKIEARQAAFEPRSATTRTPGAAFLCKQKRDRTDG